MATHYSILAWRIPWTEDPGAGATVHGVTRVGHSLATKQPPPRGEERELNSVGQVQAG